MIIIRYLNLKVFQTFSLFCFSEEYVNRDICVPTELNLPAGKKQCFFFHYSINYVYC